MRLENTTAHSIHNIPDLSLDDMAERMSERYQRLQSKTSSGKQMRRFGIDRDEYFAWKLTGYCGGDRFDESRCEAVSSVLGYSTSEVQDLAREAYRIFSLYYGEEQ